MRFFSDSDFPVHFRFTEFWNFYFRFSVISPKDAALNFRRRKNASSYRHCTHSIGPRKKSFHRKVRILPFKPPLNRQQAPLIVFRLPCTDQIRHRKTSFHRNVVVTKQSPQSNSRISLSSSWSDFEYL